DKLGVRPLIAEWSRLVVDLNRSPDNPEVVPENAFGENVPWNTALPEAARASRIRQYHQPYWNAASEQVGDCLDRGTRVIHLGVHSFTPIYRGVPRHVDIGLLFDPARTREAKFAELLRRHMDPSGLMVRYNEPYDGRSDGIGQAFRSRYPEDSYVHIEFEVNQRVCADIPRIVEALGVAILQLPLASAHR
ncbi:MAG: N-formylglutamate amidohydrolase, partial [Polyangiaceae bacterium]|nr:N-formylglutamate amidohydrolase [Polyangiaceae bacterium]